MNPNLRRRLKYVAPLVVKKVSFENLDRKYVGLEHIESWTGRILYDDLTTLPEGTVSLFEPNDVLFGKLRPYLAKVSLVDFSGACSTEALVLRPKTNQWPPFVRYVLSNGEFIDDVNSSTFGAKMPRASWEFIGSRTVPVPDLPTQKAIADFLDRETARIDQLIEKKQRMVEVLGERARSVNEHFFLDAEPISIQPLHRLYRVVTGKTPSRNEEDNFSDEEGFLWATPANLGFLAPIETTKEFLTAKGFEGQPIVDPGTVLLNGIGASVGKIGIAGACLSFNQQIHALNPKKRVLDDRFLFFQLLTLKEQLVLLANSTTLPILNSERLGRWNFVSLTLETRNDIAPI